MNDREISELIAVTQILWPGQADVDREQMILAWRRQLVDVDSVAALSVVDAYSADGERFPPPAGLIRQRAKLLMSDTGAPTPEDAWQEVCNKINSIGYFATTVDFCHLGRACSGPSCDHHVIRFSHPAIQSVVDSMGWRDLCLSDTQMADRAHFMKFYASAVESMTREVVKPPSMVEYEKTRGELGPRSREVRPLPSPVVDDDRDDEDGIAQVRAVRDALAAVQKIEDD